MIRALALAAGLVLAFSATSALADPCTAPLPKKGAVFSGTPKYYVDGDGFCLSDSSDPNTWIEVRVADFYAPESTTPEGKKAKAVLKRLIAGKRIECVADHPSWDRIVSVCTVDGVSVGDLMRRAGVREGGNGWRGK